MRSKSRRNTRRSRFYKKGSTPMKRVGKYQARKGARKNNKIKKRTSRRRKTRGRSKSQSNRRSKGRHSKGLFKRRMIGGMQASGPATEPEPAPKAAVAPAPAGGARVVCWQDKEAVINWDNDAVLFYALIDEDYVKSNHVEGPPQLELFEGELVAVTETPSQDWYRGFRVWSPHGSIVQAAEGGLIPSNHLEKVVHWVRDQSVEKCESVRDASRELLARQWAYELDVPWSGHVWTTAGPRQLDRRNDRYLPQKYVCKKCGEEGAEPAL